MDPGIVGSLTLDAAFFSALASIVLIDLILAGDNAVIPMPMPVSREWHLPDLHG